MMKKHSACDYYNPIVMGFGGMALCPGSAPKKDKLTFGKEKNGLGFFKMAAAATRHVEFLKFQFFNGRRAQEG